MISWVHCDHQQEVHTPLISYIKAEVMVKQYTSNIRFLNRSKLRTLYLLTSKISNRYPKGATKPKRAEAAGAQGTYRLNFHSLRQIIPVSLQVWDDIC